MSCTTTTNIVVVDILDVDMDAAAAAADDELAVGNVGAKEPIISLTKLFVAMVGESVVGDPPPSTVTGVGFVLLVLLGTNWK